MKISFLSSAALVLSLSLTGAVSHAQPDIDNAPKAQNPANRQPRRLRLQPPPANMTPEQRVQWLVKRQFSLLGATEAQQEAIATFIQGETTARQALQLKAQPLQTALRAGVLSETQIAALLNTYQVALEDEKTRRTQAISQLDRAVGFKKAPKIEAALVVLGLIGDGPTLNLGGGIGRGMIGGGQGGRGQNGNGNGQGMGRGNRNRNGNGNNPVAAQGV